MNKKISKTTEYILLSMCLLAFLFAFITINPFFMGKAEAVTWENNVEVDCDGDCIKSNEDGKIGDFTVRKIVTSNVNNFGLTNWAAHIDRDNLKVEECMKFEFVTPLDATSFKSIFMKYRYGSGACFYIYPLNATSLGYESAVQSFKTKQSVESITISTEGLAENGVVNGFIIQLVKGTEQKQFFIDSITPKTDVYTPGPVEDVRPYEWTVGEKADANGEIIKARSAETIGDFTSPILSIDNLGAKYPEWGLTDFASFGANALKVNQFLKYEFLSPVDVTKVKSMDIQYKFTKGGYFYIYKLDETNLCYDTAVQGFLSESGIKNFTISTELLATDGVCNGFIIQLKKFDGDPHQFFLDSLTPSDKPFAPGKVDDLKPFDWEADVEFDVNKEVITPTSQTAGNIGEYSPLTVYLEDINNFGLTNWAAYCSSNMKNGEFLRYKFTKPIDVTVFKSAELKVMHNSPACFYIYPLNVSELTYETAVQSIRTTGGIETKTISTELLAENGVCNGFIIQLKSESGVQFFLDSVMAKSGAYTPDPVEDLKPFEWADNIKYDADPTIFTPTVPTSFEEYNSLPVNIENLTNANIGITEYGTFGAGSMKKNQFIVFKFVKEIDVSVFKSFTIEYLHGSPSCYYLYPLNPITMEYEGAVQSFRTKGSGLETVTFSTESLAEDGFCKGFILQLRTDDGSQFLIDSITLSKDKFVPEPVEDIVEPDWKINEVKITGITLVHEYETGAGQDMLKIQFNKNIFTKNNEMLTNLSYLDSYIFVNGKSLKQCGIAVYALRGVFSQHAQVALFLHNNKETSLKNDGYDKIEIKANFAIQGSTDDFTLYTVTADSTWYANKVARNGEAIPMSSKFNPPAKLIIPLYAEINVDTKFNITLIFNKETGKIKESDIKPFIKINGTLLSDIANVKLKAEGDKLTIISDKVSGVENTLEILSGLKIGENIVTENKTFAQVFDGENTMYDVNNSYLIPYWVYGYKVEEGKAIFIVHLSQNNINIDNYVSQSLSKITLDNVALNTIDGVKVTIQGNDMTISLSEDYICNNTELTFNEGFMLPSGKLNSRTTFTFDSDYNEFFIEQNIESIKDLLKPLAVVRVMTGTDGVQGGRNELFVEFDAPVSHKFLPYTNADPQTIYATYGLSEVTISERYAYELSVYGIRESLYDNILIDGKSIREHSLADKDKEGEWKRFIDCNYLGNIFNDYTMQIAISEKSNGVMTFDKAHTITFKKGLITPTLCVLSEDQAFTWNVDAKQWEPETNNLKTVNPDAHLKTEDELKGSGCNGSIADNGAFVIISLVAVCMFIVRGKKNA